MTSPAKRLAAYIADRLYSNLGFATRDAQERQIARWIEEWNACEIAAIRQRGREREARRCVEQEALVNGQSRE